MFIRNYLKTILLILPITIYGQINNTPIDVPLKLSGTFGEVRSTHFHGGLDIKTKGKQGVKVYSINDGYVNRIRVSTKGYGKSLYIIHPDGITSIYGHLKRFSPKIEGYIKNIQYLNETFEIQNFPKPNLLKISSGELIGLSGNTGSSTGPHLHFELRNSKTQNPINPLRYGIKIFDTIPPKINSLYLYKVKNNGSYEFIEKMKIQKKNDSLYLASKVLKYGNLGLGINFYDKQDLSYSRNGIYKLNFKIDNKLIFKYSMDEISLNDKKHLNLFIDYINWKKNKNKVQKLFTHPKGQYEFVKNTISNGVFNINKNQTSSGIILIEDFNHNKVRIELSFIGKEEAISKAKKIDESKKLILPENEYLFDLENIKIKFHKNTFYNSSAISIEKHNETLHLGEDIYPINKSIEIFFDTNHINTTQKNKMFIGRLSKKNKPIFLSTKKAENIWSVKTDQLGKYALAIDTIPPSIKPINFKKNQWVSKQNFLKLKVTDNLSGIKSIKPSINGEWILMEYEPKNNTINYNFSDKKFPDGKHELEIILKDNLDNENVYNIIFYRKYM